MGPSWRVFQKNGSPVAGMFWSEGEADTAASEISGYYVHKDRLSDICVDYRDQDDEVIEEAEPEEPEENDERTGAFVVYNALGEAVFDSNYLYEVIRKASKMTEDTVIKTANYGRTLWIFVDGHQDIPPYCVCDCESLEGYIKCYDDPDAAKAHARKIKGFVRDYGAGTIAWDFRPCPDKVKAETKAESGMVIEDRRASSQLVQVSSLRKGQAFEFGASKLLKIEGESFLDLESLTRFKTGEDGNLVVCAGGSEINIESVPFGLDAMVRPINVKFVIED